MIPTQEQQLIREAARKFAQERLAPNSAQWEQQAAFPRAIIEEMGALGLMGMTVPIEWGGAGADNVAYSLVLQEIAAGDGADCHHRQRPQNTRVMRSDSAPKAQKRRSCAIGPDVRSHFCLPSARRWTPRDRTRASGGGPIRAQRHQESSQRGNPTLRWLFHNDSVREARHAASSSTQKRQAIGGAHREDNGPNAAEPGGYILNLGYPS